MSGERYPLPSHAAAIWLAGDTLMLSFEGTGEARGHTIALPLAKCSIEQSAWGQPLSRQLGWATLLSILRERSRAAYRPSIATKAAPSAYQIEGMLQHIQRFGPDGKPKPATLADLGLED